MTDQPCLVFIDPPGDFLPRQESVSCICRNGEQILVLQRSRSSIYGGTWCLPGGRLEKGETPPTASSRELFEETGIHFSETHLDYLGSFSIRYLDTGMDCRHHCFQVDCDTSFNGDIVLSPLEHVDYAWVDMETLDKLALMPGERECIGQTLGQVNLLCGNE
ncbi:MAG: hypothetical protein CMO81_04445 [Waddliaceae bacterium]|nr:hypothetical protein [Waddliaceae bacterium]